MKELSEKEFQEALMAAMKEAEYTRMGIHEMENRIDALSCRNERMKIQDGFVILFHSNCGNNIYYDVKDLVLCKNCKHRPKGTGANHHLEFPDDVCPCQCEDFWYSWMPSDDWFCKDGERIEE